MNNSVSSFSHVSEPPALLIPVAEGDPSLPNPHPDDEPVILADDDEEKPANIIMAAAQGAQTGVRLAVAVAFHGGLFNIGGRGQMLMAGAAAGWVGYQFELPAVLHVTLALVAAISAFVAWRAPRTDGTWVGRNPTTERLVSFTALGAIALLLSLPVIHTLVLGQITLFITAMVLFDAGGLVPRRYQGILIGLAAAIKLTPLIFIPYFLVTRQWRAAIIACSTFVAATGIAFVVARHESVVYWSDKLFETSRVGDLATIQNKSVLGLLARWDLGGAAQALIWVAIGLAIVAVALWQARRQFRVGRLLAGGAEVVAGLDDAQRRALHALVDKRAHQLGAERGLALHDVDTSDALHRPEPELLPSLNQGDGLLGGVDRLREKPAPNERVRLLAHRLPRVHW